MKQGSTIAKDGARRTPQHVLLVAHPAANSFPMMDNRRFTEHKADIAIHGQREPITLCDGKILDGRNRYKACIELGIEPKIKTYDGDPWSFVWSMNGQRRDLSDDVRAQVFVFVERESERWAQERKRIADEANAKRSVTTTERPRSEDGRLLACGPVVDHFDPPLDKHETRKGMAETAGVNQAAIARAEALERRRPDLAEQVRAGTIKPAEARRQAKKDEVAGKVAALPDGKFSVIYADPPWEYGDKRHGDEMTATGAEHHYPTMPLSELKALDVPKLTPDDCVLWLWATCPLLEDALELCNAWGFTYKAQFIWDKIKHNLGHYNSVRHELLLICTRGSMTPENVKLFDSVQSFEKTGHSVKPEEFRQIIDVLYPNGRKIELFRRGDAPEGWAVWGNEAADAASRAIVEADA